MTNEKAPRDVKAATVTARITLAEMEYLTTLAEDLDVSLSEAVRATISRSLLRDVEHGEREADDSTKWVAQNATRVTASDLDQTDED